LHKLKVWFLGILVVTSVLFINAAGQSIPADYFSALKWRLIGPFRGGRAIAAAGIPGNPSTFYFGAVGGGIWKTTDAGVTWKPIFDTQRVASIGALAFAPSNPKVIYAGTGESDIRSDLASGDGVYKSIDGGETWINIGLRDSRQISRIVIDPHDENVVYVGVLGHAYGPNEERGVYKSTDGGARWTRVLDQGPDTGVADLALAVDSPQILFATTWRTRRPPWSVYGPIDSGTSQIFRSQDGGKTWSRLAHGLPDGDWSRVAIGVASDGNRVYALIPTKKGGGLYRSDDGGNSWVYANADPRLIGRAWYFGNVNVDPRNRDVIYIPNVALYRSEDGGKTISIVRGAPGGDDYHQVWIDPQDSTRIILASDQGASISLNYGQTWSSWFNQPTAQIYHVSTDNQFPYTVYGTQQDSGSAAVLSRGDSGQISPRDWFPASGSESGYIVVDPADPNVLYVTSAYGGVARFDKKTFFSQDVSPWSMPTWGTDLWERKFRATWNPVLALSPTDHKTLYLGTQYVMKTTDGGLHWETISPDLTGAATNQATDNTGPATVQNAKQRGLGTVFTIAPSSLDSKLIWVGSDTGLVHITRDGGKSWHEVTPKGLSDWNKISMIEASHSNPAEAYAAVDRHRLDDQKPYLYRTRDYGASWQSITNGIDTMAFLRAVREDPRQKGLLFAGTEAGVYVSFDDGDHWHSLRLNLPTSPVHDLVVHDDDLVVATHGRSFWILDDITPLRQIVESQKAAGAFLYHPATAIRVDNDAFIGTPLPPEEPTAENPPYGAILDYYLKERAGVVKLEVFDAQHTLVRRFSSQDQKVTKHPPVPIAERWFPKPELLETSAGMHRFVWNLAWGSSGAQETSEVSEEDFLAPRGPKAIPGNYEVRLTVDDKTWTQPLKLVMDPRVQGSPRDFEEQLRLGREIYEQTRFSRKALAEADAVRAQLVEIEQKLAANDQSLKAAVAQVQADLDGILKKEAHTSTVLGLEKANTGLAASLRAVESGHRAVSSQAIALYQQSDEQVKLRIAEWEAFKKSRLPELNQKLRSANLAVTIAEIEEEIDYLMSR
jgi:photosystem II stability/assembly factor-like uncharacterized protein